MNNLEEIAKNARYLVVNAKTSDMCQIQLRDQKNIVILDKDGYVPSKLGIDGINGGDDYIGMIIEIKTGKILNWPDFSEDRLAIALEYNWGND